MPSYYGLIPAAGSGSRMGGELPKQYLQLLGRPLLYHALKSLCDFPMLTRIYVVLAPGDRLWAGQGWDEFLPRLLPLHCGGETRAQSVLNGLLAMQEAVRDDDWVLVHDAARPCLTRQHLEKLVLEVAEDAAGGLLAVPLADTLKRADSEARIMRTEPRQNLWQAQTPQMFRYGPLLRALKAMGDESPTDESGAMERSGFRPKLVASDSRNLKVTYPADLDLAEMILAKGKA